MLDRSEYSFDYEDEVSLESYESLPLGLDPQDEFSRVPSQAQTVSTSPAHIDVDKPQRWLKSPNSLSPVSYRPLSISWYIYEHMVEPARSLQRDFLPHFSLEEAVLLLHHKKWLVDEVTSDFFSDWPRLRDACGLPDKRGTTPELREYDDFMCPICCEAGSLVVFALLCGHKFCAPCYKRYILLNVSSGCLVRCIDTLCRLTLLYSAISLLLDTGESDELVDLPTSSLVDDYDAQFENMHLTDLDEAFKDKEPLLRNPLLVYAARVAIDALHSKFRWCPAVDCSQFVELARGSLQETDTEVSNNNDLGSVAIVTCGQAHQFCFTCHYENHLPCPCWLTKAWVKRCEDDSETVNWIDANTQGCPKCLAVIEKNGGCNHMTCGKCTHEFCWICLGDWSLHKTSNYECNRYDPKEVEELKKKQSEKQYSLGRYLHFYRRFSVHQISMDGDKNTLKVVRRCMLQYMKAQTLSSERTSSWNDVQFLSDAIRSLFSGRKTLMWTYVFAFYLKKSNFSIIFEGMQDFLNKTVEDLSQLFEEIKVLDSPRKTAARITLKRAEIMSLASLVMRRRNMLIECAHTGLQQGTLQFSSP
ncbi:hypothetical protein METBIDRAFT_63778 [Metschnikowia bicuspidata var. bicuspidata NRRL YB-4993]|uniref:RBR-type E3 ubiquitin transferase n=1 Tax=Metschnikowia bicuspidata var. bicuspidata NRRL YB-4993 TaxID=869754 RepID=A0A1A0HHI0_9ASCO|nr:hypothetical protein METBIDRAFT_63778 [Metschnikowia bicuspidata var. bicuspidata NRRL YB-4993]OBA23303.1 hypothetical protein METBIDRAFT_63778 [Metschnikowia bicuspidata var. bicuspidata NRRL YB-4993]